MGRSPICHNEVVTIIDYGRISGELKQELIRRKVCNRTDKVSINRYDFDTCVVLINGHNRGTCCVGHRGFSDLKLKRKVSANTKTKSKRGYKSNKVFTLGDFIKVGKVKIQG